MKTFSVDLYEYFKVKKPQYAEGVLRCYLHDRVADLGENRKHPAMLVFAGGGYSHRSPREGEPVALKYFTCDYNTFVLDYSVGEFVQYPTAFIESAMAITYIKENANTLNVIDNKVAVIGFSAGGHLAGTLSTLYSSNELAFLGKKQKLCRPDATVYLYPVISTEVKKDQKTFEVLLKGKDENLRELLSIDKHVDANTPPAFIATTCTDSVVFAQNSLLLALAYANAKVNYSIHVYGKGEHGLSLGDTSVISFERIDQLKNASEDFSGWFNLSVNWLKEQGFTASEN